MLGSARRLPRKFERSVSPAMKRLVEDRHRRHRLYSRERWKRFVTRIQRKASELKKPLIVIASITAGCMVPLLIGMMMFSPFFNLREIHVDRTDLRIDIEQVQHALAPLFGKRLFFLSVPEVGQLLQASIPDLVQADVTKHYPASLSIHLTLDTPIAQVVVDDPDAETAKKSGTGAAKTGAATTGYLTARGMYVTYAPSQVPSSSLLPVMHLTDWGVHPVHGAQLLSEDFLKLMAGMEKALSEQFGQQVTSRLIFLRAREFHLATKGVVLWFDGRSSLDEQLRRYRLYLQAVGKDGATDYVDLRLADRIVYK